MASNLSLDRLLEVVEKEKHPLTNTRLPAIAGVDDAQLDTINVSQLLWAFLGNHCFANPVYERRLQLTGGEDNHGSELWRSLFQDNEGGAEHVILCGIPRFQRFPNCPHRSRLQGRLGELQISEIARHAPS